MKICKSCAERTSLLNNESIQPLDEAPKSVFKAWVVNREKYEENYEEIGEWVSFPTTTQEMKEVFDRIGIDGIRYTETAIMKYEHKDYHFLSNCLRRHEDFDLLNHLAKCIEETNIDSCKLDAMISLNEPEKVYDLINLVLNENCFHFIPDIDHPVDLGNYYAKERGIFNAQTYALPHDSQEEIHGIQRGLDQLAEFFDYERYGKDITVGKYCDFSGRGYVEQVDRLTKDYSWLKDFPIESCVTNFSDLKSDLPSLTHQKPKLER